MAKSTQENIKYKNKKQTRCIDCGKLTWPGSKRCRPCQIATKPNWKGGASKKYRKCIDCGGPIKDHYSKRCRECSDINRSGSGHWNWNGGITPLNKIIRQMKESQEWRREIFKRDDYTCVKCNIRGEYVEAHHKKEFNEIFCEFLNKYSQFSPVEDIETLARLAITYDDFWDIDNGETLCHKCHNKTKRGGK